MPLSPLHRVFRPRLLRCPRLRRRQLAWILAVAGTAAVALLRYGLDPMLGDSFPWAAFCIPVILAAMAGGFWPGVLATVLASGLELCLYAESSGAAELSGMAMSLRMLMVSGIGLAISLLVGAASMNHQRLRRAEQTLRESEQRFRSVLESSLDAAYRRDLRSDSYDYLSPVIEQVMGISLEQMRSMSLEGLLERVHPEDRAQVRQVVEQGVHSGRGRITYRFKANDGQYRWLADHFTVQMDAAGQPMFRGGIIRDMTEQKQAELRQREDEAQARLQGAALEAAANGIAITDAKGTILWANPAFSHLTGFPLEELIGQNPRILKSGQQDATFYRDLWQTIRQGRAWHGELFNRRKDGVLYTEEMTITPVKNEQGQITHFISVKQDVSARKAAEQALTAAKTRAEEASQAKDHFLAVLSHELRTPLTPVTAALSLLEADERIPDDVQRELLMIRRNVELETRLIDDLLDLTRVSRGKITLDRRPLALCTILEQVADICAADVEARGIHFGLNLRDRPVIVEGDAARLHQVFWNILKNAIKFTPAGGCIGMRVWQEDGQAVAEIRDSGRGIAPELLPHIFNAFEQGSREVTKQFGGLGLGLAICKALAELHGGSIAASSAGLGQGATFHVRLPIATAAGAAAASGPRPAAGKGTPPSRLPPGPRPGHAALRVLLVEDHGDTARIMKRFLAARGHSVTTAGDVASALRTAARGDFDVLVSDLGLPDGTGLDIIQALREGGSTVPAIALSGYGQEEDLRRSRAAGFNEHLVKPVDIRRLDETIDRVVNERKSLQPERS